MPFNLRNRSLLSLVHHSEEEILFLLDLASELKRAKRAGTEVPRLQGKNIALIFEKTSTRTRCAFEVAAYDQGAHVTYIDSHASQMGHKESIKDTARVLGRMHDALEYRGFSHRAVEELAEHAGVPVFNGLTDQWHPTQMLADVLTMREHSRKPLREISFSYVGDARNNMGNSLLLVGAKLGMDVRIGAPASLQPERSLMEMCEGFAAESGARITVTEDPVEAVRGTDFIHTDIWVSMGEPLQAWAERVDLLRPFQVNRALMDATGNPKVRFMHCLPALHNEDTDLGMEIAKTYPELVGGVEVTEEVFESAASIVFDQAENRMHTIKAVMVASLA